MAVPGWVARWLAASAGGWRVSFRCLGAARGGAACRGDHGSSENGARITCIASGITHMFMFICIIINKYDAYDYYYYYYCCYYDDGLRDAWELCRTVGDSKRSPRASGATVFPRIRPTPNIVFMCMCVYIYIYIYIYIYGFPSFSI